MSVVEDVAPPVALLGDQPDGRRRRVVWKFGGTSVADPARLRAVAERLVAARRDGAQVVAVLSAMGDTTDELVALAQELSPRPPAREMDALLSVGESMSCALAAMAVHELGERAVSLSGPQAGVRTDAGHGNARLRHIDPARIVDALEEGAIVLVTGFQGLADSGDITTLGRGGSDASAVALAAALGLAECDIFTDVTGVFTADPRVVPSARRLASVGHEEMLQLAEAGAQVLQPRAVEIAAAYGVDLHVRSSFTDECGTWIRKEAQMFEDTRIVGVAHRHRDPVYTVTGLSPATVSATLADRGLPVGSIIRDQDAVRFTAPGTETADVVAALEVVGAAVAVRDDLGSVSVVSVAAGNRPEIAARILTALELSDIDQHLVTSAPSRVSCHVAAGAVDEAARVLHDTFELELATASVTGAAAVPSHAG